MTRLSLFGTLAIGIYALSIRTPVHAEDNVAPCDAPSSFSLSTQAPQKDRDFVARIMGSISLPANIELRVTDQDDVYARAYIVGRCRYIVYSSSFMSRVENSVADWPALGLFAHELGHHLAGHTLVNSVPSVKMELEADQWAGFILGYLGASENEATSAVDGYAPLIAIPTYPSRGERRNSVLAGWQNLRDGLKGTARATKCRDMLKAMDIHWSWYSEVASKCEDLKTFLDWASIPRPDIIQDYIELGMDVNAKDDAGQTALHKVAESFKCDGKQDSVAKLLSAGANPLTLDNSGVSPIGLAAVGSLQEPYPPQTCYDDGWLNSTLMHNLAKLMLDSVKTRNLFEFSLSHYLDVARSGTVEQFVYFELSGTDGRTQDDDGNTALHAAASGCNIDVIRYMFKKRDDYGYVYMYPGAQKLKNNSGKNALDVARQSLAKSNSEPCRQTEKFLSQLWW